MAKEVFGVYGCTLFDEGDETWYLNYAPWIKCSPYSEEYSNMLGVSFLILVIFIIGFPLYTWSVVKKSEEKSDSQTKERYGFIYLPYKYVSSMLKA